MKKVSYSVGLVLMMFCAASAQVTQSGLGTRIDPSPTPASSPSVPGVGIESFIQMMLALVVVAVLLKYALPKLAPKLSTKFGDHSPKTLRIVESMAYGGGNIAVLEACGSRYLIASTPQGTNLISAIQVNQEAAPAMSEPFEKILLEETSVSTYQKPGVDPLDALKRLNNISL